jgi:hypothetical protein
MADSIKNPVWDKPPDESEKQARTERNHDLMSNLLTLLLAGIIVAIGIVLPTVLYPYLDVYRGAVVHLEHPSDSTLAGHVFEEPVTLYPWNLYDEQNIRPLTNTEEELLESRGIPDFLFASLSDRGWQPEEDLGNYRSRIISSFSYLDPPSTTESGFFVLVEADITADGLADINCAVDLQGNLISLVFLTTEWDEIKLESPIGLAVSGPKVEPPAETPPETSEGTGTTPPTNTPATDTPATAATPPEGPEATQNLPGAADLTAADAEEPANKYDTSHVPIDEDNNLWSFAYATARDAYSINQMDLFFAFRQLELTYENRYSYPYYALLPLQSEEVEILPEVDSATLTPTFFATGDSLLYIYDLSNGERLILFLDPVSLHCRGFNLQRF